jgi:aspartyl-tRNA(Asn)/glutamyl-tRNA(Gln) amidotransferase subunit C
MVHPGENAGNPTPVRVDRNLVRELAELARLQLDAAAEAAAVARLQEILAAFDALAAVPTEGMHADPYPLPLQARLRPDHAEAPPPPAAILAAAPQQRAGAFLVPRVIEG